MLPNLPPPSAPRSLRAPAALATLVLSGCFGLDAVPSRDKGDGRDLDESGIPLDSGDPIDSAGDENRAPVADAGADDVANVGAPTSLDGSASYDPDDDPLSYAWRFVSKPGSSAATLVDEDRPDPQFIPDVEGRYELGLVVSDGAYESVEDTVEITAAVQNGVPVANAGSDQSVTVGDPVILDGSGSTDPDGDRLQYAWTLVTRPGGSAAALNSTTSASPRFVADVAGTYEVSLTVSDGTETSSPDSVRVTAQEDSGGGGDSGCGCRAGTPADAFGTGLLVALTALLHRRPRRR